MWKSVLAVENHCDHAALKKYSQARQGPETAPMIEFLDLRRKEADARPVKQIIVI